MFLDLCHDPGDERGDILEITRTQQYIDSRPSPMELGANPKSKGKAKTARAKAKARARMQRTNRPRKERTTISDSTSAAKKETERPCRSRWETGGRVAASSKRHSGGRAIAVLTLRRETHVNVPHSHALSGREQHSPSDSVK